METSRLREFLGALDRGDEAALRQILLDDEDHILVTSRYNEGETALHIASRLGHIECMLTLIKCGSDVNARDRHGNTSLVMAACNECAGAIKILLSNDADVTVSNNGEETALVRASRRGYVTSVDLLLAASPSMESLSSEIERMELEQYFYLALIAAAGQGHTEVVTRFLDSGIDVNLNLDADYGTALHAACESGNSATVRLLLEAGADVEALRESQLQTPLMRTCEYGFADILRLLIQSKCDVDRQTEQCSCALMIACHYGNHECAKILIEKGAYPDRVNPWGFSPLFMAADHVDILRMLIARGDVDVNRRCGEREETALHVSSLVGERGAILALLEAGADVDTTTIYNESALWLAAYKNQVEAAHLLITHANPALDITSNGCQVYAWDYLPIEIAIGNESWLLAQTLVLAGCSLRNTVYFPRAGGHALCAKSRIFPCIWLRPETLVVLHNNQQMALWFIEHSQTARSLKLLCRTKLRRLCGAKITTTVEALPLPHILKSFILCRDI